MSASVKIALLQYSDDGNGGWNFNCQHGPNECKGNLYQACLLNALEGQEKLQLDVLNCILADYQPHLATKKCMNQLEITTPSYQVFKRYSLFSSRTEGKIRKISSGEKIDEKKSS